MTNITTNKIISLQIIDILGVTLAVYFPQYDRQGNQFRDFAHAKKSVNVCHGHLTTAYWPQVSQVWLYVRNKRFPLSVFHTTQSPGDERRQPMESSLMRCAFNQVRRIAYWYATCSMIISLAQMHEVKHKSTAIISLDDKNGFHLQAGETACDEVIQSVEEPIQMVEENEWRIAIKCYVMFCVWRGRIEGVFAGVYGCVGVYEQCSENYSEHVNTISLPSLFSLWKHNNSNNNKQTNKHPYQQTNTPRLHSTFLLVRVFITE